MQDGYDIIGDAQTEIGASRATEADLCTGDKKWNEKENTCTGNVLVGVFAQVWIRIIPLLCPILMHGYAWLFGVTKRK